MSKDERNIKDVNSVVKTFRDVNVNGRPSIKRVENTINTIS